MGYTYNLNFTLPPAEVLSIPGVDQGDAKSAARLPGRNRWLKDESSTRSKRILSLLDMSLEPLIVRLLGDI
jgi:hypothetical protein